MQNNRDENQASSNSQNLRAVSDRIERLVEEIGRLTDPPVRDKAEELVRLVMELYGGALARIVEIADEHTPADADFIERLAADDLIASLLILHGLHPLAIETRIERALDRVRPYLGSHGGDVKLLGVNDGVASLRLEGSCHGCPSSTLTMKLAIEKAIEEAAPEVARIEVENDPPGDATGRSAGTAGQLGYEIDRQRQIHSGQWVEIGDLPELATGNIAGKQIGGMKLVVCRAGETFFAYQDGCPSCRAALCAGNLHGNVLTCSSCGRGFDVRRAGQSTDASGMHMEPLPLLAHGSGIRVAVPALGGQ